MPRVLIEHLDDPRIAIYRSLKPTNQTRTLDQFVVEGEKLVERLMASRFPLVSILMTDTHEPKLDLSIPDDIPRYIVPSPLIHALVGYSFHRGILACGHRMPSPDIDDVLNGPGVRGRLVICPRISNPDNLGAITRISDVFGLDAILAGPSCPDYLSRRVLRVSMGSALKMPVIVLPDLTKVVDRLSTHWNVEIWAAVAKTGAEAFDSFSIPERWALILGNEDEGVDEQWLTRSHRAITIPMATESASLNVAVAAGILLYQLSRN